MTNFPDKKLHLGGAFMADTVNDSVWAVGRKQVRQLLGCLIRCRGWGVQDLPGPKSLSKGQIVLPDVGDDDPGRAMCFGTG